MSNSRNWVAQKDCPYAAGFVDVTTGATAENPGDATFAQAFGSGPIDVYWMLEDSNDPPRSMAGKGSLSGGSVDVSSPMSTFDGTTYDNAPSAAITLTSPVIIRCTLNARVFDEDVIFEGDSRLSDARTPTAHAASHANGGADEIDVSDLASGAATLNHVPLADGAGGVAWGAQTGGGGDLSNAEFPDSAHFASQVAADATVAFTDGNKQSVDAAVNAALTLSAPGVGSYLLKILNSSSLTGITPTPKWDSGTAPTWAGTSVLALYYDGTDWFGSAIVGAA